MKYRIQQIFLLLFLLFSIELPASVSLENAIIISPDKMENWEKRAANDMKTALERITGKTFRILPEKAAPEKGVKIYIGNTRKAAFAKVDVKKLAPQEFQLRTQNGNLYIAGGTPTGTSYGVSFFLQKYFGVYQLDFDAFVYPANPKPVIPELDMRKAPDIMDRNIYNLMLSSKLTTENKRSWHEFYRRNFLDWDRKDRITPGYRSSYGVRQNHTFFQYVSPKKYFRTHPEFFSMQKNGKRSWSPVGQLCLSNKEMRKVAYDFLEELIRKERAANPESYPTLYDLSQEDSTTFMCNCPECLAMAKKYGGETGLLLDFVNEIATKIAKKYPDVFIRTFAYCFTEQPLDTIAPARNVIIQYCDLYGFSLHMYPLTDPVNKSRYDLYMKWAKKTPELMLWDYILGKPGITAVDAIIADARLFKKTGLKRIFCESEYNFYKPVTFHILQYFLQAQMFFDSSQDGEKLIDIFMKNYYGSAAAEMKGYLNLIRKYQKSHPTAPSEWRYNRITHTNNLDFLTESRTLLQKGLAKVEKDPILAGRVGREMIAIDSALFKFYRNDPQKASAFKLLQKEYEKVMLFSIRTLPLREEHKKVLRSQLADELAIVGMKFKDLPPEIATLPESRYIAIPYIYLKKYLHAKVIHDKESSQVQSTAWIPPAHLKHGLPKGIGCYGKVMKKGTHSMIRNAPADEKYHWYKIGDVELDRDSIIYAADWHIYFNLRDFYTLADGFEFNPNCYEAWISVKLQGPAYVPGSKKENAFIVDRALLIKKY